MTQKRNSSPKAQAKMRIASFFLIPFAFVGCARQETQVTSDPTMAVKQEQVVVPIKTQQENNEIEFGMELIDIGENPESEPKLLEADTPLYLFDSEDPFRFPPQIISAMDKVGVEVKIFDNYPDLYEACPVLIDPSLLDQRKQFVESLGYTIRCHPVHWDVVVSKVLERQNDYLVEAVPVVSEYCDQVPLATEACVEKWVFPKNSLNTPSLVSRRNTPQPGDPDFPYGTFP
jgi:hypothetical protein